MKLATATNANHSTRQRKRIRKIFSAAKVTHQQIAHEVGAARVTVTLWFLGRVQSARLDREIPAFAERVASQSRGAA